MSRVHLLTRSGLAGPLLTHRFTLQLDAVGVVHQAVENAVGECRVPDLGMPLGDRQLAGQNGRASLITVVADFQEVPPFDVAQRSHGPVVDDEGIDARQPQQAAR